MAKNKSTTNVDNRYPSNDTVNEKFKQSKVDEEVKYPLKVKKTFLVHKRNTKKELNIGRKIYTFWGHEKIPVPKDVISHPDFKGQEKYFLINR